MNYDKLKELVETIKAHIKYDAPYLSDGSPDTNLSSYYRGTTLAYNHVLEKLDKIIRMEEKEELEEVQFRADRFPKPAHQKWEYHTRTIDVYSMNTLTPFGDDGWEIVSTHFLPGSKEIIRNREEFLVVFKRSKLE